MKARAVAIGLVLLAAVLPSAPAGAEHVDDHVAGAAVVCNGEPNEPQEPAPIEGTDAAEETIVGTPGRDVIIGWGGKDTIFGLGGDDIICGGEGDDVIEGNAGNDALYGDAGEDVLKGQAGDDTLLGMSGNDTAWGGDGRDDVQYWPSPVAIDLDLSRTKQPEVLSADGNDELDSIEVAYGSAHDDTLRGDGGDNYLDGDPGNDVVKGLGGDDHVIGDRIDNGTGIPDVNGNDTLYGGPGDDHLWGHGGDDIMRDPSGTNRFAGDAGNDDIQGGEDFDYLDYSCRAPAGVFCIGGVTTGQVVDLGANTSSPAGEDDENPANDHGTDTLRGGIEGVQGTTFGDTMLGRNNVADPEGFGDYFWPGAGDDTIDGRDGADYVDYSVVADDPNDDCTGEAVGQPGLTLTLAEDPLAPEVTGYLGNDELKGVEHAIGSAGEDALTGTDGNNDLWGGCSDDVLSGSGGSDTLSGDEQRDVVNGGDGDDRLVGGAGDDALYGDGQTDIVSYDSAPAGVTVHLGSGTAQGDGEDAIFTAEVVLGSGFDDVMVGGPTRDIFIGGTGADDLWGRGGPDVLVASGLPALTGRSDGNDRLYGGAGADTADYSRGAAPGVVVDLGAAQPSATEDGTTDAIAGIEAVQGSEHGDTLRGNAAANRLFGGRGGDTISGGGGDDYVDGDNGDDTLRGGTGTDVADFGYAETNAAVVADLARGTARLTEDGGQVLESLAGLEMVSGTPGADRLLGSDRTDYLAGNAGDDDLRGYGADDFLFGGTGFDQIKGHNGDDQCYVDQDGEAECENTEAEDPGWWQPRIGNVQEFRADGTDEFLADLGDIIDDLRRLHRRRLHR